jgi:hypothetical protein
MGRLQIAAWVRELVEAAGFVPDRGFPSAVGDLAGFDTPQRTAILRVLERQPTRARVRRVYGSWFHALVGSGVLAGDSLRMSRGTYCLAVDGHLCRSLGEKRIDDLLYESGVVHEREPQYPGHRFRGDFLIGDLIVEYLGMSGDARYDEKQRAKREAARSTRLRVLELLPTDVVNAPALRRQLEHAGVLPRSDAEPEVVPAP